MRLPCCSPPHITIRTGCRCIRPGEPRSSSGRSAPTATCWTTTTTASSATTANPIGALQALSPERVVYLGSASKSLSPVLRLGWMVLPTDLVDAVIDAEGGSQFYVDGISR